MFSIYKLIESEQLAFHNDGKNFKDYFKCQKPLSKAWFPLIVLRRANHQNHRENYPIINVECYFLQSIYVPYTEHLLVQMPESFENQKMKCQSLRNLIPKYHVTLTSSLEMNNLLELYQQDVDSKLVTVQEIMRWKEKWKKQDITTLPKTQLMLWKLVMKTFSKMFTSCLLFWQCCL